MAIYFFPLSLLNDVIHSDNLSQCGAACSRGTQQVLGAAASLRPLCCEAAACMPMESQKHLAPSPKEYHFSVQVLLLGCFLFQCQVAS